MAQFDFKAVPPWGWVIAVGVGGYIYYTKRNSNATASADTSTTDSGNGAPIEILDPNGGSTATVPTYQTNEQWATAAINWLIAQGYNPALSNSAITKGIAGGQDISGHGMSASEYSLWSLALQHLGSPPEPVSVSPPSQAPGPVTGGPSGTPIGSSEGAVHHSSGGTTVSKPPTQTKTIRYFTVKPWPQKGSSLYSIAEIYYHDGNKWPEIYNANKKGKKRADGTNGVIGNANLIYPGEKLIIP